MTTRLPPVDVHEFIERGGSKGLEREAAAAAALEVSETLLPIVEEALHEAKADPRRDIMELDYLSSEVRRLRKRLGLGPPEESSQTRREKTRERVRKWRAQRKARAAKNVRARLQGD